MSITADIADAIIVSDFAEAHLTPLKAEVYDTVTVADFIEVKVSRYYVEDSDTVIVTDSIVAHLTPLKAAVYDTAVVADSITATMGGVPANMHITYMGIAPDEDDNLDLGTERCQFKDVYAHRYHAGTMKSGATQSGAGAAANELWRTSSHLSLPDGVVMIGL